MSRQALINGNFDVWQRGTSFSTPAGNAYTADRWKVTYDGTIGTFSVSQQTFAVGQSSVPNNPKYYLEWNQTAAGSGSTFRAISQRIEGVRLFSGQKCTVSFWAKADSARTITTTLRQNFGSGGTPSAVVDTNSSSLNLTTSWQKFTYTFTLPSISGKTLGTNGDDNLELFFFVPVNVIMTIDIAQVQLNAGDQALPFQPKSYNEEFLLCQRFYQRYDQDNTATIFGLGFADTLTTAVIQLPLSNKMRVIPTLVYSAVGDIQAGDYVTAYPATALALRGSFSSMKVISLGITVASGLTQNRPYYVQFATGANKYLAFDAEL
jgi:hypothetical protein